MFSEFKSLLIRTIETLPIIASSFNPSAEEIKLDNVGLLCYNCYFLQVGNIFNDVQIQGMEEHKTPNESKVDWKIDNYHMQRLKELGLEDSEEDEFDIISRL